MMPDAPKAVDGSTFTYSSTLMELKPWWAVDLQRLVVVYAVAIKNIEDGQFT